MGVRLVSNPVDGFQDTEYQQVGETRVAFWRRPGDVPVVFFHGGTDGSRGWQWLAEHIPEEYDCYFVDLRGHGRSSWRDRYQIRDYVDDGAGFIAERFDEPVFVVGHSLGGMTTTYLAVRHRELVRAAYNEDGNPLRFEDSFLEDNAVVIMAKRFRDTVEEYRTSNQSYEWLRTEYLTTPITSRVMLGDLMPPEQNDYRVRCWADADWRIIDPVLDSTILDGISSDNELPTLDRPLALAIADPKRGGVIDDQVLARLQDLMPNVVVTHFETTHGIHLDKPAELADNIFAFFAEHR